MSIRKKLKLAPIDETNLHVTSENEVPEEDVRAAPKTISKVFLELELQLNQNLHTLKFNEPVVYVYNPVEYAFNTHSIYVDRYCTTTKKVLFLGLNPGPWGMSQTGVPFGEVNHVRDWLQIDGDVDKPNRQCPNRIVVGFDCKQSEISGQRFWGLMKKVCDTPETFFKDVFVHNYCPLAFMDKTGKNITPDAIKGPVQKDLLAFCDQTLCELLKLLRVDVVIAVGRFVEKRVKELLKKDPSLDCRVKYLLHPSPRVPGNEKWLEKTETTLHTLELMQYFKTSA